MDASFIKWLKNALAQYDKVVFLYRVSEELCIELKTVLKKEKRKLLLLTDVEIPDCSCSQRKLGEEERGWLLELYFSYSFADNFVFLTDKEKFPWPSMVNFAEAGLSTKREILEAMLV